MDGREPAEIEHAFVSDESHQFGRRNATALALRAKLQYDEAEAAFRAILNDSVRVVGPEHPETLQSRINQADVFDHIGKKAEAETALRAVLAIRERVLGPEHRDTLQSRLRLCQTPDEHRSVLVIQQRVLGSDHPEALVSQDNLARKLYRQRRDSEAEAEFRDVLAKRLRALSPEHPNTLESRIILAFALNGLERHAEAEAEYRSVVVNRKSCQMICVNTKRKRYWYDAASSVRDWRYDFRKNEPWRQCPRHNK